MRSACAARRVEQYTAVVLSVESDLSAPLVSCVCARVCVRALICSRVMQLPATARIGTCHKMAWNLGNDRQIAVAYNDDVSVLDLRQANTPLDLYAHSARVRDLGWATHDRSWLYVYLNCDRLLDSLAGWLPLLHFACVAQCCSTNLINSAVHRTFLRRVSLLSDIDHADYAQMHLWR